MEYFSQYVTFVDLICNLQISKLEDTVPKLSLLRDAKLSAVSNRLHIVQ